MTVYILTTGDHVMDDHQILGVYSTVEACLREAERVHGRCTEFTVDEPKAYEYPKLRWRDYLAIACALMCLAMLAMSTR